MSRPLLNGITLKIAVLAVVILTVMTGLLACTASSTPESETLDQSGEIPKITKEELLQKLENGEDVLIVDTRYEAEYKLSHIEGAVSAPYSEIVLRNWQPPPDREAVLYCS